MSVRVRFLRAARDLSWDFTYSRATFPLGGAAWSGVIDPFPGYGHDRRIVEETADLVHQALAIAWPITFWIADREEEGRTNGWSQKEQARVDDAWRIVGGAVFLSGKRIPPHPAMTRYLVAHEYGHHVEYWIEQEGAGGGLKEGDLRKEYARLREMRTPRSYGGQWHRSPGEVFADDFRILVAGVEKEFWPHPGIERPEDVPTVKKWWRAQLARAKRAA